MVIIKTGIQQKQAHESVHLFYEPASQESGIKRVLDDLISQQRDEIRGNLKPGIRTDSSLRNEKVNNYNKLTTMSKGESNYTWQKIYNALDCMAFNCEDFGKIDGVVPMCLCMHSLLARDSGFRNERLLESS